jgi:dephospho-CoA kinase
MSKISHIGAMNHQSLKIGITGGIGSGKTTVCKIFETLPVPVYYADERAKILMANDASLRAKIKSLFGEEAYNGGKALNRAYIANIVFKDTPKLEALNALVHPAVADDYARWIDRHTEAPYTLKEAALLFESGSANSLDKIIMVYAPLALRIRRVMERDNTSEASVRSRVEKQMDDEEKRRLADFEILNDGGHSLIQQVLNVHRQILQNYWV